jgi:hypothetical protein
LCRAARSVTSGDASRSGRIWDAGPGAPGRRCGRGRALPGRVRATGPTRLIGGAPRGYACAGAEWVRWRHSRYLRRADASDLAWLVWRRSCCGRVQWLCACGPGPVHGPRPERGPSCLAISSRAVSAPWYGPFTAFRCQPGSRRSARRWPRRARNSVHRRCIDVAALAAPWLRGRIEAPAVADEGGEVEIDAVLIEVARPNERDDLARLVVELLPARGRNFERCERGRGELRRELAHRARRADQV